MTFLTLSYNFFVNLSGNCFQVSSSSIIDDNLICVSIIALRTDKLYFFF